MPAVIDQAYRMWLRSNTSGRWYGTECKPTRSLLVPHTPTAEGPGSPKHQQGWRLAARAIGSPNPRDSTRQIAAKSMVADTASR